MNRTHKEEMIRWAESPEGTGVWYSHNNSEWVLRSKPDWNEDVVYIVDDWHSVLRKLQVDDPETKFEYRYAVDMDWTYGEVTEWNLDTEYRVKAEPKMETYYEYIAPMGTLIGKRANKPVDESWIKTGRSFELPAKD